MPLGYASYNMGGFGTFGGRRNPLEELGLERVVATPEDEESFLRSFASGVGSGLSTVGNVLDTPGAAVRSLLLGQNPLPGVFNPELRPSMGEVLSSYGILPENNAGFHPIDDPRDAFLDVVRFGAEVAADPLTYLTLGGSALSKGGQIAKNAGLLQDLSRVAPAVGPRQGRLTTSLGDLLAQRVGDTTQDVVARSEAVQRAASGLGLDAAANMNQPVGALASFAGIPFGTGETAQKIAGGLDTLSSAVRYSRPGSAVARLFNAPTQEAQSRVGQELLGPEIFRARKEARAAARGGIAEDVSQLVREGGALAAEDQGASQALRRIFEGVDTAPPEVADLATRIKDRLQTRLAEAKEWGINAPELYDKEIGYFPRFLSQLLKKPTGESQVASVFDPSSMGRQDVLRNIKGGTSTIIDIAQDKSINALIEAGAKPKAIANQIESAFGHLVPGTYAKRGPTLSGPRGAANLDPTVPGARSLVEFRNQHQDLASYLKSLSSETRAAGIFGNHPLQDLAVREQSGAEAHEVAKTVLTSLADPKILDAARKSPGAGKGVPLSRLLPRIGFDRDGALAKFAQLTGVTITDPKDLKALGKTRIPTDLANDLFRFHKGITGPDAANEIIGALDSVTNLFKAGVTTPWPAFHVRNLVSGQFQNWVSGMFSPQSVQEADAIMRGRATSSLANIPAVKAALAARGLGPEQAGDVIREMAFQHETLTKYGSKGADVQGKVAAGTLPTGAGLGDLKQEFAGGLGGTHPITAGGVKRKFLSQEKGTDLNPLHQRGVGGRTESTFGPAAAGQDVGHYVEGLNRLAPFIEQLRRGVDPAEAARRVTAAQVDYSTRNLTAFERQAMTRIAPFYKFTKGMVPYTLRQLWEKPGGKLSQTIQGVNQLRGTDALTPDFIAQTAAIPLGQNEQGDPQFLSGLGLAHEDALSFLGSPQDAGLEALSRLNPLLKMPLEAFTGETFFQRGPDGGRPIEELDPLIGRILSNVAGLEKPVNLPDVVEHVAANSPISRLLTTARTLTTPSEKKSPGQKALNLLTGVRTTTVNDRTQDAILRQRLEQELKDFEGTAVFSKPYLPLDELAQLSRNDQLRALQIQALLNMLAERGRERNQAERAGRP